MAEPQQHPTQVFISTAVLHRRATRGGGKGRVLGKPSPSPTHGSPQCRELLHSRAPAVQVHSTESPAEGKLGDPRLRQASCLVFRVQPREGNTSPAPGWAWRQRREPEGPKAAYTMGRAPASRKPRRTRSLQVAFEPACRAQRAEDLLTPRTSDPFPRMWGHKKPRPETRRAPRQQSLNTL